MGDNPKWLKRRVRARMEEKGIKYTTALREIQTEMAEAKEGPWSDGDQVDMPSV